MFVCAGICVYVDPTLSEAPCPSSTLSSAGQASSPPWKNPKWSGLLPENKVFSNYMSTQMIVYFYLYHC